MAVPAHQRDYKRAYKKHYHAYSQWGNRGSDNSKRLILIYCVECGLKFMIMHEAKIFKTSDAQDNLADILKSHDIFKLIRELKAAGEYRFPQFKTKHGDCVRIESYHQVCRYCIPLDDTSIPVIESYDNQLDSIAKWIGERV